jgi:N-acetylglutamate synthase-like GNAT family acetyltransferase
MRYHIERLPYEQLEELEEVATLAGMTEPIDYNCDFFVARNGSSKIYGFAGVNLNMPLYPQFEHIVIHPQVQKSRLAMILMTAVEDFLKKNKYSVYVCYILNTMNWMQEYAVKFGFSSYSHDDEGVWFVKNLNKKGVT